MKITQNILHIPPFISTTWGNIRSLTMQEDKLAITLLDNSRITIPGLSKETIENIFSAHASFLETHPTIQQGHPETQIFKISAPIDEEMFLNLGLDNLESLGAAIEHNQAQANLPDLPQALVEKIAGIARAIAPNDLDSIPEPEPHCNCIHCQISRAIHNEAKPVKKLLHPEMEEIEEVKPEELSFHEWSITQIGEQLYSVANPLDLQEKYNVYLGSPVGCTCGQPNCEHVLAVLKS